VTFRDQPAVQDLAARGRALLRDVPCLDLIPGPWLHLTTQGVGFSDEVGIADLAAITAAARFRLAAVPPPAITIGPARVLDEGIAAAAITVTEVQLILLGRDEHVYEWETEATVGLGGPLA
jgi:hypothetical protein